MCIRDDCNVQYKDFKQYTSKVVNDFVQEVFYLGGVQDEEYSGILKSLNRKYVGGQNSVSPLDILHRLLDSYSINMRYGSVQEFILDSTTNQILKHCIREQIIGDIVSSILRTLQSVEFIQSIDEMLIDTFKLPLLRYDAVAQYVYIPYYSYIYIVRLMSYKGSGKDYRHIVSVSDIVNNNIPTNIKHLDKNMRLILSSKCVCNIDIEGNYW